MPSASQILLFQSTLLMRGATRSCRRYCRSRQYFNPRSSCEERRVQAKRRQGVLAISIHAPHARSDFHDVRIASICRISIHAPHARSDDDRRSKGQPGNQISIHAPHARSDALSIQPTAAASFQSTLLMRGATASSQSSAAGGLNFNPRSSCEERLIPLDNLTEAAYFNPRSSCEERPRYLLSRSAERPYFNPRSSCEERPAPVRSHFSDT